MVIFLRGEEYNITVKNTVVMKKLMFKNTEIKGSRGHIFRNIYDVNYGTDMHAKIFEEFIQKVLPRLKHNKAPLSIILLI